MHRAQRSANLRHVWRCDNCSPMGIEEHMLEQLRRVFENYSEILAVYAFGSQAAGFARKDSDYDLAIVSRRGESARSRKMDILADLVGAGIDNVDLAFLDHDTIVLSREAVRMNQLIFHRPEFDRGAFHSRIMRMYFDFLPYLKIQRQAMKERILHGTA